MAGLMLLHGAPTVNHMADAPPQFGTSNNWTPSLRIEYVPVQLKPKGFVRTAAPQGDELPTWMKDKQWQERVEEMCAPPLLPSEMFKGTGQSGNSSGSGFQANYGKQKELKNSRKATTPIGLAPNSKRG